MSDKSLMLGIGIGFDAKTSSCWTFQPKTFSWTNNPLAEYQHKVYVDFGILQTQHEASGTAIGWLSESSEVLQWLIAHLEDNISLRDRFKVIFTHDERLINKFPRLCRYCPNGSNLPWIDPLNHRFAENRKTEACSFLASDKNYTTGHRLRYTLHQTLPSAVERYGKIAGKPLVNKVEALASFRFSIVVENGKYDNYVTEKLMDCFATKTVPIYWGASRKFISDLGFDNRGIFMPNDEAMPPIDHIIKHSERFYQQMLPSVEFNYSKVQTLEMADDYLYRSIRGLERSV
jgi:hypothetical protein